MRVMVKESCPYCASEKVRRGSNFPRRAGRWLFGVNKRYCPDCGGRWSTGDGRRPFLIRFGLICLALLTVSVVRYGMRRAAEDSYTAALERSRRARLKMRAPGMLGGILDEEEGQAAEDLTALPEGMDPDSPEAKAFLAKQKVRKAASKTVPGQSAQLPDADDLESLMVEVWGGKGGKGDSSSFGSGANILAMIRKALRQGKMKDMGSFESVPKKQLWEQYGHYFGSQEEARSFYKEYHDKRKSGKLKR